MGSKKTAYTPAQNADADAFMAWFNRKIPDFNAIPGFRERGFDAEATHRIIRRHYLRFVSVEDALFTGQHLAFAARNLMVEGKTLDTSAVVNELMYARLITENVIVVSDEEKSTLEIYMQK